jgi:hypothetical protein
VSQRSIRTQTRTFARTADESCEVDTWSLGTPVRVHQDEGRPWMRAALFVSSDLSSLSRAGDRPSGRAYHSGQPSNDARSGNGDSSTVRTSAARDRSYADSTGSGGRRHSYAHMHAGDCSGNGRNSRCLASAGDPELWPAQRSAPVRRVRLAVSCRSPMGKGPKGRRTVVGGVALKRHESSST